VGDDEDFGVGGVAADDFGGGEAIHGGHGDVEQDHVGLEFGGFFYGVLAVFGFAADGPIGVILEEQFQASPYGGAVVCDQDSNLRHGIVRSVRTARYCNYEYSTKSVGKCTSGVLCSTCGQERRQENKKSPFARLRDPDDGSLAQDAGAWAQVGGASGDALCAAAGEKGDKRFAVAGERGALTCVLRFGAGPMLGYTSRPVGGREPLLYVAAEMRCARRDCATELGDATWRL